jgi:hypothetical protein
VPRGFDYVGDNDTDSHVWHAAREVFAVVQNQKQATTLRRRFPDAAIALLPRLITSASLIGRVLRVKQWSKNLLLLVPLFTAHLLSNGRAWALAGVGVIAFCLACSAVYICNDLLDVPSDRLNLRKSKRPTACGAISIPATLALMASCLTASVLISWMWLPKAFEPAVKGPPQGYRQ